MLTLNCKEAAGGMRSFRGKAHFIREREQFGSLLIVALLHGSLREKDQ